ncbi:protein sidekick-like, partial [Amphibalanus amphitrite]|uniref:protein sidekick-like n=1 Tax=Amphibalanus amphitrite TaxID=1232801 RepID=UPI001C92A687
MAAARVAGVRIQRRWFGDLVRNRRRAEMGLRWQAPATLLVLLLASAVDSADLQAPRFITQPSSGSSMVNEGYTKIMQCQAFGAPQPEYRWLKDGQFLGDFTAENFYRIPDMRRADAGEYQCIARNSVGAIFSEKAHVEVAYMSQFNDTEPRTIAVQSGHAAVLDLPPIDSRPKPSVRWLTARQPTLYGIKYAVTSREQLVILSVEPEDEQEYRARATNTQAGTEETSGPVALRVVAGGEDDVPPQIVVPPADQRPLQGEIAKLSCVANARPLYSLETTWYKDGTPIGQAGVAYSFDDLWNRTLSLLAVGEDHTGVYSCQARLRSANLPEATAEASVTVLEPPHIDARLPPETLGDLGRTVTLTCASRGRPEPQLTWYKDTVDVGSLNTEGRYSLTANGSLVIRNLKISDTGMYQCTATNPAGEHTAYTWLRVKSSVPVMLQPPENVTVLDGQDATLSCRAEGAPPPDTQWLFNGKLLEDTVGSGRLQVLETGDLLVTGVRPENSGLYTCQRANEVGQVSASAVLSIMVRTQIIQPPVDSRVILGHVASLQCGTSVSPGVDVQVTWYHNARPLRASSRIRLLEDGGLEIREARAADVGRYTCEVVSSGGNASRSAELVVVELPYAPTNVRAQKVPSLQKSVKVSWTSGFDGNSAISKFIIQSRRVPISSMVTGSAPELGDTWATELANVSAEVREVTLTGLTASAAYQFRVSAVNAVGEGGSSRPSNIVLLPQEAPSGPPQGLVGSARSSSEIMTQWQAPRDEHRNGQLLGYILRYRLHGYTNAPWSSRNISNEAQRNYLIGDLITWKDYDIQVAAYNNKGTGVFSDSIRVKTREGVPEAAPTAVKAEPVSSTSVRVSWIPPDPQLINGINQGYKLQAWTEDPSTTDTGPEVTATVAPSPLDPLARQSALLEGLSRYTAYNVTVLCFTSPGDGARSGPVAVTTLQDVPGPVASMQFESVTDRSVTVLWTPPEERNGILTGYSLSWTVEGRPEETDQRNVSAEINRLEVNDLQPTTTYSLELVAWTEVGAGPARRATLRSGVEPVLPSPPTKLGVSNIQAFSVVLQFTPGFDGNSSITKWAVQAHTARNQTWEEVFTAVDPAATTLTVDRLVPFMKYRLRIVAYNVVGASLPSEPTQEFQTIQAPPAHAPYNVTVRALSATSLRVGWIPLQQVEWYGVARGYNISFRMLSEGAWRAQLDTISIEDHNANSFVLDQLEEYMQYEVLMQSYNDVGSSASSLAVVERTREAAPGAGPENVQANATSSTTVVVTWGEILPLQRNGIILGYRVYYGYKGNDFMYKDIDGNQTRQTTLTQLRKFTRYSVQVLGRTREGDGALSLPPATVQTHDDVPGAPSNVSFPDVSYTFARVIWDEPAEPNGLLLGYKVTYHPADSTDINITHELPPESRTYTAAGLQPERSYQFSVSARSRLGWGLVAKALVYTTSNRERPQAPSAPQVSQSQVLSDRITFSWTPGRDGFAPLRYYTVQLEEEGTSWQARPDRVDPAVTSYTVRDLKPFTTYRFRIQATNDMGPSGWSDPSETVKTHPAAPRGAVGDVRVIPVTTTSVRVEWRPLPPGAWSGDAATGGYRVEYRPRADFPSPTAGSMERMVNDIQAQAVELEDLVKHRTYEVQVVPYNSQGDGTPSRPS